LENLSRLFSYYAEVRLILLVGYDKKGTDGMTLLKSPIWQGKWQR